MRDIRKEQRIEESDVEKGHGQEKKKLKNLT